MCMANIFKNMMISEEIVYIGQDNPTTPVIPAGPGTVIPAQAGTHFNVSLDANVRMGPRLRGDDRICGDDTRCGDDAVDSLAQERALLQEQTNALSALLQSIPKAISDNRQQLSSDIADIVLLIVSKFFINQQQNKDAITHQITQILMQLHDKQNLELSLHPHDLALIQQGEINIDLRSCKNIRLKADEHLRLGGCIVTSEHGVFDASIERQIDNLKHVLLQMKSKHE